MSRQLKDALTKAKEPAAPTTLAAAAVAVKANIKEAATQSVAVYARLKPTEKGESRGEIKVRRQKSEKGTDEQVVTIKNLEFALECVFEEDESQLGIYSFAGKERVEDVLGGKNATILAYGQTGSGARHAICCIQRSHCRV